MILPKGTDLSKIRVYIQSMGMFNDRGTVAFDIGYSVADKDASQIVDPNTNKPVNKRTVYREAGLKVNTSDHMLLEDIMIVLRAVLENFIADDIGIPRDPSNKEALDGNEFLKWIAEIGTAKDPQQGELDLRPKETKEEPKKVKKELN